MTLLLKHWKPALILILLIAVIGLSKLAIDLQAEKKLAQIERIEAVKLANGERNQAVFYRNRFGDMVAKVERMTVSAKNALELNDFQWLQKFEAVKKNGKNLESANETSLSIKPEIVTITKFIPCKDSIKAFDWVIQDEYNNIAMTVLDTPVFEIRVPLFSVDYWQRRKILGLRIGRKEYLHEITSPNKLVKIDSVVKYDLRKR